MKRLPKWVTSYRDRHGKVRLRFRRLGFQCALPSIKSPEFERAYAEAVVASQSTGKGPRSAPGSFDALCVAYYSSPGYLTLKDSTKETYRKAIEPLRVAHAKKPIRDLKRVHIETLIAEKVDMPGAANFRLRMLRMLMKFAVDRQMLGFDPTTGIRNLRIEDPGFKDWGEENIATFRSFWPTGSKPRLAFELLLCTGQRRSDMVTMGRQHVSENGLNVVQSKTGAVLWIPIHEDLQRELKALPPGQLAFLLNEQGRPFKATSFGNWFRARVREAGVADGFSAHGLRKAACRRLAEAGCSASEIQAISGHKTLSEVQRYVAAANQKLLAKAAVKRSGNKFGEPSG